MLYSTYVEVIAERLLWENKNEASIKWTEQQILSFCKVQHIHRENNPSDSFTKEDKNISYYILIRDKIEKSTISAR